MSNSERNVSSLECGEVINFAGKTKIKIVEIGEEEDGKREGVVAVVKAWVEQDYLLGDKFACSFENSPKGGIDIFIHKVPVNESQPD